MKEELASARKHPAALASIVIAGVAMTVLAVVTVAYLLGWVPMRGSMPSAPGSIAVPGQQVTGTVEQGGLDLLPGETLVTPADALKPAAIPATAPVPTIPKYSKPAPFEPPKSAAAPRKSYVPPLAPSPSSSPRPRYAPEPPSRAAPARPAYNRGDGPGTSFERSTRNICVNCGVVASIGSSGPGWEVRVRFEDGSTETLRYPDRPRLRIGDRVHLEDGRLVPE
ncbi:MAG: hypothetical protein ABI789_01045 [Usitatibacter sp.]